MREPEGMELPWVDIGSGEVENAEIVPPIVRRVSEDVFERRYVDAREPTPTVAAPHVRWGGHYVLVCKCCVAERAKAGSL